MKKNCFILLFVFLSFLIQAQELPTIAVFDFQYSEVITESEMTSIISLLSSELFKTGKYTILDIQQRNNLMEEMQFSSSGMTDEQSLLEIGKLLSAHSIVTGKIGTVGDKLVLNTKMLETETAKIQSTSDGIYDDIGKLLNDIPNIARILSDPDSQTNGKAEISVDSVIAFSTLGAGVVMIGGGTYFLIDSLLKLTAVQKAKNEYEETATDFDVLYDTWQTAYAAAENSDTFFITGASLIGAGLISSVVSIIFFAKDNEASVAAAVSPTNEGLSFQINFLY